MKGSLSGCSKKSRISWRGCGIETIYYFVQTLAGSVVTFFHIVEALVLQRLGDYNFLKLFYIVSEILYRGVNCLKSQAQYFGTGSDVGNIKRDEDEERAYRQYRIKTYFPLEHLARLHRKRKMIRC
jgi:hypothetical protein